MSTTNKIFVSSFTNEFKKLTSESTKRGMVQKHVLRHYSPILHKMNVLQNMMNGCVKEGKAGKYIDMGASKMNFIMAILILYTDLAIDKIVNEEGKEIPDTCTAYDQLKETGALDMIIEEIGADITELLTVQENILGTWHNENCSTAAYISGLVEKISMIFSTAMGKEIGSLADVLSAGTNEDKAELVAALMDNFRLK